MIDVQCTVHKEEIDDYVQEVLGHIESASWEFLPVSGGGVKKPNKSEHMPGWNTFVKPYAEDNKWWFSMWKLMGSPTSGHIYHMMRTSKLQYKYAVRRLKRASDNIKNNLLVNSLMEGDANIFLKFEKWEVKLKTLALELMEK